MNFDKTKAMRNAERYLALGKIRSAINEYEQVVEFDPKDYGTKNTLGDMYRKNSQLKPAVECYTSVAEHYANQGFAQKAIAVYNKIAKIEPDRIEISEKLAELYKSKGAFNDARVHYKKLSDHYQITGRKLEALAVLKQIALLDPKNTEAYITIGRSYLEENHRDEALKAFVEAGARFAAQGSHAEAIEIYTEALQIKQDDLGALAGIVKAKTALGSSGDAAVLLSEVLAEFPHSREINIMLIDCHLNNGELADAEAAIVKLVELEPANYPKFLNLTESCIATGSVEGAVRALSMSSEHLLMGGQANDLRRLLDLVLEMEPGQIEALRLMTRYCAWQKDEAALTDSLVKLAEAAQKGEAAEDERYALLQLTMLMPYDTDYRRRLTEINEQFGWEEPEYEENLFDQRFLKNGAEANDANGNEAQFEFTASTAEIASGDDAPIVFESGGGFELVTEIAVETEAAEEKQPPVTMAAGLEFKLQKEIEGIQFYIDNGYADLAEKALRELQEQFGDREEIEALFAQIRPASGSKDIVFDAVAEAEVLEPFAREYEDFMVSLELEDSEPVKDQDYETHYHTATAYREMGLLEEAIREFQEAVSLVSPNDGTRRFFACANLLGHCFMEKGMPSLALKWFHRTFETEDLNDDEKQGLWYELAGAYEADGDADNAARYFEQVYAENVNFRDVSERVKTFALSH